MSFRIVLLPSLSGHLVCQSSTIHSYPTRHSIFLLSKLRCPTVVGYEWMVEDWQTNWPERHGSNTIRKVCWVHQFRGTQADQHTTHYSLINYYYWFNTRLIHNYIYVRGISSFSKSHPHIKTDLELLSTDQRNKF